MGELLAAMAAIFNGGRARENECWAARCGRCPLSSGLRWAAEKSRCSAFRGTLAPRARPTDQYYALKQSERTVSPELARPAPFGNAEKTLAGRSVAVARTQPRHFSRVLFMTNATDSRNVYRLLSEKNGS